MSTMRSAAGAGNAMRSYSSVPSACGGGCPQAGNSAAAAAATSLQAMA